MPPVVTSCACAAPMAAGIREARRSQGVRVALLHRRRAPDVGHALGPARGRLLGAALLSKARPLDGADLQPPTDQAEPAVDLDEYADRAAAAHAALRRAHGALAAARGDDAATSQALRAVTAFGVSASTRLTSVPAPLVEAVLAELIVGSRRRTSQLHRCRRSRSLPGGPGS